jgi:hypothetical protein
MRETSTVSEGVRPARGAVRFWWPAIAAIGGLAALWCDVPFTALFRKPLPPRPIPEEARAALVTLDPAYAAQVFGAIRATWVSGARAGKLSSEGDAFELSSPLPPLWLLEKGRDYPGEWKPNVVKPLEQSLPEISAPVLVDAPEPVPLPPPKPGIRVEMGSDLGRAKFAFSRPALPLPEASGELRFEIETDEGGQPVHVLLLSARTQSAALFEQAIRQGHADGPARGTLRCAWLNAK